MRRFPATPQEPRPERFEIAAGAAGSPEYTFRELAKLFTEHLCSSIQADLWFIDHGVLPKPRPIIEAALEHVACHLEENAISSATLICALWFLPPARGAEQWEQITAILQELGVIGSEHPEHAPNSEKEGPCG